MEVQSSDFASLHDGREAWGVNDSLSEIIKDTNCIVQFADQYGTLSEANGIFNQVTLLCHTSENLNFETDLNFGQT